MKEKLLDSEYRTEGVGMWKETVSACRDWSLCGDQYRATHIPDIGTSLLHQPPIESLDVLQGNAQGSILSGPSSG
jgi:hypothetical protein